MTEELFLFGVDLLKPATDEEFRAAGEKNKKTRMDKMIHAFENACAKPLTTCKTPQELLRQWKGLDI